MRRMKSWRGNEEVEEGNEELEEENESLRSGVTGVKYAINRFYIHAVAIIL